MSTEYAREGQDRTRIIRKGDLDDAKADLQKEMKLWLLGGTTLGTTLSGLLGAMIAKSPTAQDIASGVIGMVF